MRSTFSKILPRSLTVAFLVLAGISIWFFYRQNYMHQIGGPMSIPKLLWLDYALMAWFIFPFFIWRCSDVAPALRRIYRIHLMNWFFRGVIELWLLYGSVSWTPLYGIAHDIFSILLLTGLIKSQNWPKDLPNRAAGHFLTSIRLGLVCEASFAWLFHRARGKAIALYFASHDAHFAFINALTSVVLLFAYPDFLWTLWAMRRGWKPAAKSKTKKWETHYA